MTTTELANDLVRAMALRNIDMSAAPVLMARLCAVTSLEAIFLDVDGDLYCEETYLAIHQFNGQVTDVVKSYDKKSHDELEARLIAGLNKNIPVHETMKEFV
jgi:hypothetical protein